MSERILLVDDDEGILRTLRITLKARGYAVEAVMTGTDALLTMSQNPPDLVVLDLGLPDIDGVDVLRRIRLSSRVPVIVLSARHQSEDKVEALEEGADDFVTKPFGSDELMARIRAALRRGGHDGLDDTAAFVCASFTLDFATTTATKVSDEAVHLTPTEWRFLAVLARHRNRLVPHEAILKSVWGPSYGRESNYLRVYANQIRRKLELDPAHPRHLVTEPGLGYRLVE
ncbi:MAG: response regulator transcription factor [Actinomycetales bacterium]|nr:response regulator transcription factor [Actinomycetales bacterium]